MADDPMSVDNVVLTEKREFQLPSMLFVGQILRRPLTPAQLDIILFAHIICMLYIVLSSIKKAQQQNGLRHEDYMRYRQYCTRRLRRVRKALQFSNSKSTKNYKHKTATIDLITEKDFLVIPLMSAERCWSHAMQIKADITENTQRKRHHFIKRLKKAVQWSKDLSKLCTDCADSRTQLEAEAYSARMEGDYLLGREHWSDATKQFVHAKTVYEQLAKISVTEDKAVCLESIAQIEPSIRYCTYLLQKSGDTTDMAALELLKKDSDALTNDLLRSKLQSVLAQAKNKQAEALHTINWKGSELSIATEQMRMAVIEGRDNELQLVEGLKKATASTDVDTLMDLYGKVFTAYDDLLTCIRDENKEVLSIKQKTEKSKMREADLSGLQAFATFKKQSFALDRNVRLVNGMRDTLAKQDADDHFQGKRVKYDDLVFLYEKMAENVSGIQEAGDGTDANGKDISADLTDQLLRYRALRAYFMSMSYERAKKYAETYLLYGETINLLTEAVTQHEKNKKKNEKEIKDLNEMKASASLRQCQTHAMYVFEDTNQNVSIRDGVRDVLAIDVNANQKLLEERLESWAPGDESQNYNLLSFPPKYQATPCKPVLFDLAWNYVEFNSLEERLKKLPKVAKMEKAKKSKDPTTDSTPAPAKEVKETSQKKAKAAKEEKKEEKGGWGLGSVLGSAKGAPPGLPPAETESQDSMGYPKEPERRAMPMQMFGSPPQLMPSPGLGPGPGMQQSPGPGMQQSPGPGMQQSPGPGMQQSPGMMMPQMPPPTIMNNMPPPVQMMNNMSPPPQMMNNTMPPPPQMINNTMPPPQMMNNMPPAPVVMNPMQQTQSATGMPPKNQAGQGPGYGALHTRTPSNTQLRGPESQNMDLSSNLTMVPNVYIQKKKRRWCLETCRPINSNVYDDMYHVGTVEDPNGIIMVAKEDSDCMMRAMCGGFRDFEMDLISGTQAKGAIVANYQRPYRLPPICCLFQQKIQTYVNGQSAGKGTIPFTLLKPRANVYNASGNQQYVIIAPPFSCLCGKMQFTIHQGNNLRSQAVGRIKQESSAGSSFCVDQDSFSIQFPQDADNNMRMILVGTAMMLNAIYMENAFIPICQGGTATNSQLLANNSIRSASMFKSDEPEGLQRQQSRIL